MNDKVDEPVKKGMSQSKLDEFILRQKEGRAYSKIARTADQIKDHHEKLDKEHNPLVNYCHTALHHGFDRKQVEDRLRHEGHSEKEIGEVMRQALSDIEDFGHPDMKQVAKSSWTFKDSLTVERFFIINIFVLGLLLLGLTAPYLKQTGLSADSSCNNIKLELLNLRGDNQLCYVEEKGNVVVKFMIRNKGKDIGGYDLLLGGEKLDNLYNYPITVKSGETVARVIDYDPNRYGKLKAFSFIPYSWEGALKRCSAAGLHYPAVPACS